MVKIKIGQKETILSVGQDAEELKLIADGNAEWYSHSGKKVW